MANPVHYRDRRTAGITGYIKQAYGLGKDEIYAATGIQSLDFNTLSAGCREPRRPWRTKACWPAALYSRFAEFLLTGVMATEYTIASTGAILLAGQATLADGLLDRLDIPAELFRRLLCPQTCSEASCRLCCLTQAGQLHRW